MGIAGGSWLWEGRGCYDGVAWSVCRGHVGIAGGSWLWQGCGCGVVWGGVGVGLVRVVVTACLVGDGDGYGRVGFLGGAW